MTRRQARPRWESWENHSRHRTANTVPSRVGTDRERALRIHPAKRVVFVAAAVTLSACGVREPQIDQADVERIITALAADEMQGRRTFEPGADAAAELISGEFAAIGLEPFAGADGYLQSFAVYSLQVDSCSVTINGTVIGEESLACSAGGTSIHWVTGDPIEIIIVGPDDDPMQAFGSIRRARADALVLMSREHEQMFRRLQGFIAGGSRSLDQAGGPSTIMVLTDEPAANSYEVDLTASTQESGLANVVGVVPGRRSDEIVLFSGHYDHIGIREAVDGDSIANGANDDASGTTAVIELARYFHAKGQPERTLVFAAFTAEEMGGYGSSYLSRQLDPDEIVAMFNIEMIGKVSAEGPHSAWITGFERSDFGAILQQAVQGTEYTFHADPYPEQNLFYRSDNATLARLGVPAHSISTTQIDIDPDYHQVSDEVETLDLEHLTDIIRAIAVGASTIVMGEATPSRIDPQTVE